MDTRRRRTELERVVQSVVRLHRQFIAGKPAPFAGTQLSQTQLQILYELTHSPAPVTPGMLAATLQVTPGAVTQAVSVLKDNGFVTSTPHPGLLNG